MRSFLSVAVLILCGSVVASASILTFQETFNGTGTFDGNSFTNSLVTISLTGDTANITSTGQSPNVWIIPGPLTVSVAGLGSTLLTNTGAVVVNNGQGGVMAGEIGTSGDPSAPAFIGIFNSAFGTYSLSTTFGPVSTSSTFGRGGSTGSGSLSIGTFDTAVTFTVTSAATTVPEPISAFPLGTGLAMLFGIRFTLRRRAVNPDA
jgi:hypothetical protein